MSTPERGTVHRDFRPATKALVGAQVVVSNVVGAAIVLGLAGYVLPTQSLVADLEDALDRNLWAFGFYVAVAVVVGLTWGWRWGRVPAAPDGDAGAEAWLQTARTRGARCSPRRRASPSSRPCRGSSSWSSSRSTRRSP